MPVNEKQLAQIFSETGGIVAAYFFGSQVSGKTDRFSDYDFAVLFRDGWQEERARLYITADLMEKAFSAVGQDNADVVDLSTQPLWFQQVVVKTGRVIYETDREKRHVYERELMRQCLEEGLLEYVEDSKMKVQDVQINFDTIEKNVEMLTTLSRLSHDEFMAEFWYPQSAIHLLQTSIESLVDISRYVIRSLGLPSAREYWQVPTVLADAGYLDAKRAATYVEMVKFRNLVVHHYYRVDAEEIYKILTESLSDIRQWRDRLVAMIEKGGA